MLVIEGNCGGCKSADSGNRQETAQRVGYQPLAMFLPFRRDMLDAQPEEVFAWIKEQQPQHDGRCYVRTSALRAKHGNGARAFFAIIAELAACGFTDVERWRLERLQPGLPSLGAPRGRKVSGQWDAYEALYAFTPVDAALCVQFETFVPRAGTFPALRPADRKALWEQDGGRCVYCKAEVTVDDYQVDHKIPKSRGGTHRWENLATACFTCNGAKGPLTQEEFAARRRRG